MGTIGKVGGVATMLELAEKLSKTPEFELKLDGFEIIVGKEYRLIFTGDVKVTLKTGKGKKK